MSDQRQSRPAGTLVSVSRVLVTLGALLLGLPQASREGFAAEAVRCPHESHAEVTSALRSLRATDEPTRLAAAAALGQVGRDALPELIAVIPENMRHDAQADTWPAAQRDFAIILTDVIRAILSDNPAAILRFRQCTTDVIVKPLIWAARGDNQRLRVNAANILANVVDNTSVCFVLHHLKDTQLSTPARANLLGITNSMASYAYKDNVASITQTIEFVSAQIGSTPGLDQTRAIIKDITSRIARSENRNTSLEAVSLAKYCANYDFNAARD